VPDRIGKSTGLVKCANEENAENSRRQEMVELSGFEPLTTAQPPNYQAKSMLS
jgi:hypothetical protein